MAQTTINTANGIGGNSPHTCSFLVDGDDATLPGVIDLLASGSALQEGPLKALLRQTPDWTVFNLGGTKCGAVHVRSRQAQGSLTGIVLSQAFWTTSPNRFNAGIIGRTIVEIRLSHTARY